MTTTQQTEALRLADAMTERGTWISENSHKAATEIRRLHARVVELEAEKRHKPERDVAAIRTLAALGYDWHGGEQWKPPLGKAPDFDLIDSLRNQLAQLTTQLEAIGAGGVESLRKKEQE